MGTDYSDCVKMKYEWQDKLAVECRLFCLSTLRDDLRIRICAQAVVSFLHKHAEFLLLYNVVGNSFSVFSQNGD